LTTAKSHPKQKSRYSQKHSTAHECPRCYVERMRGEECDTCGARADNPDELLNFRSQRHHSILAEMLMRRNVTVCKYFVLYRRSRRAEIGNQNRVASGTPCKRLSPIRTGCANQRPSASGRWATSNRCRYRDRQFNCRAGRCPQSLGRLVHVFIDYLAMSVNEDRPCPWDEGIRSVI